ncbi:hypothetical protein AVEN_56811-1 [Araneus ventricosus]|uniref:Uncharacterized protein n=1 Tax=Araneus ventricosus TaxID=182803 RepID=A0A4Y2PKE9_ARAVE|nr:hypothetical protein AVEN_56811-1 [Araneus ventricosus]
MKNAWHNLWSATIFYEDEENVDTDFKGFQILKEKAEIFELLECVKSRGQEIAEDDAFEVLQYDDEAPTGVSSPMPKYAEWC